MLGYIGRHWRGEHSLARSYWVNTFASSFLLGLIVGIFNIVVENNPPAILALQLVAIPVSVLVGAWQSVGIWRSANRHIGLYERRFWARAAQAGVAFGVLFGLVSVGNSLFVIKGTVDMVFGLDGMKTDIALGDFDELQVTGNITYDTADEVAARLQAKPSIFFVLLTSDGGYMVPADRIRKLIEERQAATFVSDRCLSACTLIFSGGSMRIMTADAALGFHKSVGPGFIEDQNQMPENNIRRLWLARGIAPDFINRALGTASSEMWFPTLKELVESGFVTHVHDGGAMQEARAYCRKWACD